MILRIKTKIIPVNKKMVLDELNCLVPTKVQNLTSDLRVNNRIAIPFNVDFKLLMFPKNDNIINKPKPE